MKRIIDPNAHTPVYQQLYMQMREDIVSGIYPFGTKLPSKRTMALDNGISTVTVEHAYNLLCDEGYIEARERSGFFVVFRSDDGFVNAPKQSCTNKIPVTENIYTHTEFPFSVLSKAMRKVINNSGERILERSPNLGCFELRETIRLYLAQNRGIIADVEQIIIGSGSEHLYSLLVGLLGRDRVYAIESPSYKKIEQVYESSNVKLEKLALTYNGIDSTALKNSTADILHISPYRSYPSGVTASASKRHEYLRWAEKGTRYIIEDDFESEFSVSHKPEETLFSHSLRDNVIYMNSFSKTISPSLRLGYMILPKALAELYEKKLGFLSCSVPTYMQLVLAELMNNGDFERHINRVRRNKRKEIVARK